MHSGFPGDILVPVDFSDLSAAALRFALRLGSACGSRVTAVHVHHFEAPSYFTPAHARALAAQFESARADAEAALRGFVLDSGGSEETAVLVREGDPSDALLRAAADGGAGLIVMGTHGRSGIRRLMLGSVAERVLRGSRIPVLTVRGAEAPKSIARVVCPVNDSEASRSAFRAAAQIASCCDAELSVLHVDEGEGERRIDDLCAWRASTGAPECVVREFRREGQSAEEIIRAAAEWNADLLVIGAEHRAFFDSTVLGTTTVRVVRHAQCPVLTVIEGAIKPDAVSGSYPEVSR